MSGTYRRYVPDILLFSIAFGFLSGVIAGHDWWQGIAFGCMLLLGLLYFGRRTEVRFTPAAYGIVSLILATSFTGGFIRFETAKVIPPEYFESRIEETIEVTGKITNDPAIGEGKMTAIIYIDDIGLRLTIKTATQLSFGDSVTVSGTLTLPENFLTDEGTEFDYVSYLGKDDILYLIPNAKLVSFEHDTHFSLKRALFNFRHSIEEKFFTYLPEREAGLLAGILLGTKTAIDENLYNSLVRTSTVHIVALSGYNVSIVADTISKVLSTFLPRLAASLLGGLGIIMFVLMTGASSTAMRAGLMALIMILSRIMGRPTDAFRVMALAALILVLINPSYVIADVSFQLSFMATLGLLVVSPTYVSWLEKRIHPVLAEAIGTTFAAETAVAPFIMYKMGLFSLISLPVNVAILPFIPMLMLGGFILVCVGFTLPFLGGVIAYPSYLIAAGIIETIMWSADFSFASVHVPVIPLWGILGAYFALTWYFISRSLTESLK